MSRFVLSIAISFVSSSFCAWLPALAQDQYPVKISQKQGQPVVINCSCDSNGKRGVIVGVDNNSQSVTVQTSDGQTVTLRLDQIATTGR